jgi:protein gp37
MANIKTGIEWTDKSWNPTTGCNKISPGCFHCYAEEMTKRFPKTFPNGFNLTLHPDRISTPLSWKQPCKIFVNSMSDLFHKDIPLDFIKQVFQTIERTPQHTYQILTKRHKRLLELAPHLEWHPNIWMGVSVENQQYTHRIDYLRQVPAQIKFLSCEPLLGRLNLDLDRIDWVIVGGESGAKYRPVQADWVRSIRDQCQLAKVAFFFKQWGGRTPKSGGNELEGKIYQEFPNVKQYSGSA